MPAQKNPSTAEWPLGDFLRESRGKMSRREAARRADISESRFRQVEDGYQLLAGGLRAAVNPRPETVAAMCKAIGADVRKGLQLAGYNPDMYPWLLQESAPLADAESREWFTNLPREEREAVLAELQRLHVDTEVRGAKPRRKTG